MKRINLSIAVLAASALVNYSSVLASSDGNPVKLPGVRTCAVAAPQGPDLINELPPEVQASCLLLATSGENGIAPKNLMLVCQRWRSLVKDPILNKLLLQEQETYHINLSKYTRAEAEAKLDADLARKRRIRDLTIEGATSENSYDSLMPADFFPSRFLTHGPLQSLRIIGNDYSVNSFTQGANHVTDHRSLPEFELIKELKRLEITSIIGNERRARRFLINVLPSLEALEKVAIGSMYCGQFYENRRSMPKLRKIIEYKLGTQDEAPYGAVITNTRVYEKTDGVWKGGNSDYDTLVLEELNNPDILPVE